MMFNIFMLSERPFLTFRLLTLAAGVLSVESIHAESLGWKLSN